MTAALCLSMFVIIMSIIQIFFKDIAWDMQDWGNKASGRESERTAEWEMMSTITGILGFVFVIILMSWANSVS